MKKIIKFNVKNRIHILRSRTLNLSKLVGCVLLEYFLICEALRMRFAYETMKTTYFIKILCSKKSHLFVQIILCFGLGLTGCADNSSSAMCTNPTKGKARLVAYRVAKHSHLWLENVETKKIYDISGVGGRREPSISLGSSIPVEYCLGDINFDKDTFVKEPVNRDTRFVALPGYEYLYQ